MQTYERQRATIELAQAARAAIELRCRATEPIVVDVCSAAFDVPVGLAVEADVRVHRFPVITISFLATLVAGLAVLLAT
jgi:D-serine deaminase-like pyridoxal phosphate-dependent protein